MRATTGNFMAVLASELSTTPTAATCPLIVPCAARAAAAATPEALDQPSRHVDCVEAAFPEHSLRERARYLQDEKDQPKPERRLERERR